MSPLRRVLGAALTTILVSQTVAVPPASAAGAADPLPRAYRVDSVAEVPDVEFQALLAVSADGTTAVHLSPRGDDSTVLVATNFQTGENETVGLDLDGQPVPRVAAVAVSGNGRTVAILATGSNAAELHLPADVDPDISSAIFVRDRVTKATTWVPVPDLGVPASRHALAGIAISEDGKRLAAEVSLPLPKYAGITSPEGVLVATLAADTAPAVRIVGPEDLVTPGGSPAEAEPEVRGFALSGSGSVLAVNAYRDSTPVMLRFDAATGARLPGDRVLADAQQQGWLPNLDRTGRRTAFGNAGAGVVVADLAGGPQADVALTPANPVPYVSGDVVFGPGDPPTDARLSADGGTVAFVRAGALWTQPAQAGYAARLASPGLDGRIAEPPSAEAPYPDAAYVPAISADGSVLGFLSASTAFVAPRTQAPQPSHLYRSVPADLPAPTWPQGAELTTEPGTTTVAVTWPAASSTATAYEVGVDGGKATTINAPTTQAVLSDLTPGATVRIAVIAKDAAGRASAPLTASVTLRDDLPPGDAPLSALAGPGARVRLQWERSSVAGVTGYRVLRDGVKLVDLGADVTSYDDTKVANDTGYAYSVALLRGDEQIQLTREVQVRIDKLALTEATATLPRVVGTAYAALERDVTFAMIGAPGFRGTAQLTVRTASEPAKQVQVPLAEKQPGQYTGSWTVAEGVVEIVSGTLRLADGVGYALDRAVTGLPAPVSGLLRAHIDAPGGDATGARLQVWSDSTKSGSLRLLTGDTDIQIPLLPAADHQITATRQDGAPAMTPRTLAIAAGQAVTSTARLSAAASATVTVSGTDGKPLANMRVRVEGAAGPRAQQTDANGRTLFTGLDAGATITVSADIPDWYLAARGLNGPPSAEVTLRAGDNAVQLAPVALGKVRLSGTTLAEDGKPVVADIVVSQDVHGLGVTFRTASGSDGSWGIDVYADLGKPTRVEAKSIGGGYATSDVTIGDSAPAPVGLVLPQARGWYRVTPTVKVKMLDAEVNEQPLDDVNAAHYRARLTWPGSTANVAEQVQVNAPHGVDLQLCVDGVEAGLPAGCATATTGADPRMPLSVTLIEKARFTARILDAAGAPITGQVWARVDSLDGSTKPYTVRKQGPDISISVPKAGTYLLRFGGPGTESVQRLAQAPDGRITSLGDVRLSATSIIDGTKSSFTAVTDSVLPGGTAQLRAEIAFRNPGAVGTARLTLPAGVTVPEGGVLLDGKAIASSIEPGVANVLVVQLPAAPTRTLQIFAQPPQHPGVPLPFSLTVMSGSEAENLGTATVLSGYVSLRAPDGTTATGRLPVSGRAPAGAVVVVREGGVELAHATAGPGGLWNAIVDLGTGGDDVRHHLLQAEAQVNDLLLQSGTVDVVVDPHAAVLQSVTMGQAGGRSVTFPVTDGVARFPYTFVPGKPVVVVARLSGPATNVRAQLGATIVDMQAVAGETDTWQASIESSPEGLGDLSVSFDPIVERPTLPVPPMPTESLVDPQDVTLQEPETDGATVSQAFSAPVSKVGPDARVTGRLTVTKLDSYRPSPSDLARAKASGVHVYEATVDATRKGDVLRTGSLNLAASAVVDLSTMRQEQPSALTQQLATLGFFDGTVRVGFTMAFNVATNGDSLWSAISEVVIGGKYGTVAKLQTMAISCRDEAKGRYYQDQVASLQHLAYTMDVLSAAGNVAALAAAPATFGLGTIAIWAVIWANGKALEANFDSQADWLKGKMLNDPECRKKIEFPKDPQQQVPHDSPGLDPRDYQDDTVADPTWIYDPSGVVYEGSLDRKVAGVTATLLHAASPDGPWSVWNAEWYGQSNPLTTDDAGHYGWDVPEGWWKVAYTKDGYLPAESRVLKVLPPHTDVNVNLVRAGLAEVAKVEADEDGLTVTFSQPMRAAQVLDGLAVTTPDGDRVAGQWTAASRPAPVGHPVENSPLATTFRFTGEMHSGKVKVLVDELVQDHVGRFIAEGTERTLTVDWHGPDEVPPQVSVTGVADGGFYRLGSVPSAGCRTVDEGSGVATEATPTVTGGTSAGVGVYTATCAGAKDKAGNIAEPVAVTYTTAYVFDGFFSPVQNDGVLNKAKAGQAIPLKWRITDATGAPVTNLAAAPLTVVETDCGATKTLVTIEQYASDGSELQNLGNGYYQVNWKTPKAYAGTCQRLWVDLGEGPVVAHTALFQFVK